MHYGPNAIAIMENNTTDMLLNADETIYTKAYELKRASSFGIAYKAASTIGSVDVTINIEQGYQAPGSPEASDATFVTPANISAICSRRTTETTLVIQTISPVVAPWLRFRITGAGSNAADTIVNIWLMMQES